MVHDGNYIYFEASCDENCVRFCSTADEAYRDKNIDAMTKMFVEPHVADILKNADPIELAILKSELAANLMQVVDEEGARIELREIFLKSHPILESRMCIVKRAGCGTEGERIITTIEDACAMIEGETKHVYVNIVRANDTTSKPAAISHFNIIEPTRTRKCK